MFLSFLIFDIIVMPSVSFIIGEHRESREWVKKMLDQIDALPLNKKEAIIVTSADYPSFIAEYDSYFGTYDFPVEVIGRQASCGGGRNVGAKNARYENLIWTDCHVCFSPDAVMRLLDTLNKHPDDVVGPAIRVGEFPSCAVTGGNAHGVAFRFVDRPWEWLWLPAETKEYEFEVPLVCGCAYSMKRTTYDLLAKYGGFLHSKTGLGAEEEFGMRLWRLGRKVYIEPRSVFMHYFKGHTGHKGWDEHSTSGFYESRVAAIYINVFSDNLFQHIERLCKKHWGNEWDKNLRIARNKYSWLRLKSEPLKDKIDERWFLRVV